MKDVNYRLDTIFSFQNCTCTKKYFIKVVVTSPLQNCSDFLSITHQASNSLHRDLRLYTLHLNYQRFIFLRKFEGRSESENLEYPWDILNPQKNIRPPSPVVQKISLFPTGEPFRKTLKTVHFLKNLSEYCKGKVHRFEGFKIIFTSGCAPSL